MTRSTRQVYQSHHKNLFNILKRNCVSFEVFLHTWKTEHTWCWANELSIPNDYKEHKYLNPNYYQIDNQDEFLSTINLSDYYYPNEYEWVPELIRNHLCSLQSLKRCFNMCKSTNKKYDYVIVMRPDVNILSPLPFLDMFILNNSINTNNIYIPSIDWNEGYNDRAAIIPFHCANWYCNRIDEIIEFRRNNGRIVSEKYLKYIVDKYYKIVPIKFNFIITRPTVPPEE